MPALLSPVALPARRPPDAAPDASLVDRAVELFLARTRHTKTGSPHTERAYRTDLRDFARFLARRRLGLDAVSRAEAARYLAELAARAKPRTVRRRVSCIRSFYRFLRTLEIVADAPFDDLDLPAHDPKSETHKVLTDEQFDRALTLLADDVAEAQAAFDGARLSLDRTRAFRRLFVASRRRAIFSLAGLGGLRTAEILDLQSSAFVQTPDGFAVTFQGKGGKRRTVPLAATLTPALVGWLSVRREVPTASPAVFVTLTGRPVRSSQVRRDAQKLGQRLGVAFTFGPHALRRTFATRGLRATGDLRGVGDLLGHASVSTTELYTHVDQAGLRDIVEATSAGLRKVHAAPHRLAA